jgi:membrane protein DedA with SNARE-associated domain
MRDSRLWFILVVLLGFLIGGAWRLRASLRSRHPRRLIWITIVFLLWLMAGFVSIRGL